MNLFKRTYCGNMTITIEANGEGSVNDCTDLANIVKKNHSQINTGWKNRNIVSKLIQLLRRKPLTLSEIYHVFEATTVSSKASIRGTIYYHPSIFKRVSRGKYTLKN